MVLSAIFPISALIHAKAGKPNREASVSDCYYDTDQEGHQNDDQPLEQIFLLDEVGRAGLHAHRMRLSHIFHRFSARE